MDGLIVVIYSAITMCDFYTSQVKSPLAINHLRFNSSFQTGRVILRMLNVAGLKEYLGIVSFLYMRGKLYALFIAPHHQADQIHVHVYLAAIYIVAICRPS